MPRSFWPHHRHSKSFRKRSDLIFFAQFFLNWIKRYNWSFVFHFHYNNFFLILSLLVFVCLELTFFFSILSFLRKCQSKSGQKKFLIGNLYLWLLCLSGFFSFSLVRLLLLICFAYFFFWWVLAFFCYRGFVFGCRLIHCGLGG